MIENPIGLRGQLFPVKLAMSAGLIKILLAILMVSLGVLSIMLEAALSQLGGGLWAGTVVGVSGFLGICAARQPHIWVYVSGFMTLGGISMASSGILVVVSATAWARDNEAYTILYVHQGSMEPLHSLSEVLMRRPSVLVSGALVVFGVVDCLVSLACIVISVREVCGFYGTYDGGLQEGHNRKERLYRWLKQQKNMLPQRPVPMKPSAAHFLPLSSSDSSSTKFTNDKIKTFSNSSSLTPQTQTTSLLQSSFSNQSFTPNMDQRKHVPDQRNHVSMVPKHQYSTDQSFADLSSTSLLQVSQLVPYPTSAHLQQYKSRNHPYILKTSPYSQYPFRNGVTHAPHQRRTEKRKRDRRRNHNYFQNNIYAAHQLGHPGFYYPHLVNSMTPYYPTQPYMQYNMKKKEKKPKPEKRKELTDEQIDKSYTGMDRDIAEGFISSLMEPGVSINRIINPNFNPI